jgi:hypothetical protein
MILCHADALHLPIFCTKCHSYGGMFDHQGIGSMPMALLHSSSPGAICALAWRSTSVRRAIDKYIKKMPLVSKLHHCPSSLFCSSTTTTLQYKITLTANTMQFIIAAAALASILVGGALSDGLQLVCGIARDAT